MNPAYGAHDYYYRNHSGKYVCFSFESKRRIKTKVIEYVKLNYKRLPINQFNNILEDRFDLKLVLTHKSRKYIMYDIVDLDFVKLEQECNDYINKLNSYNLVQYYFKRFRNKYILYRNNEEYIEAQSLSHLSDWLYWINSYDYECYCNLDD